MRLNLAPAQDQQQAPAGSLAWDPEYADYLRWVAGRPLPGLRAAASAPQKCVRAARVTSRTALTL
jgi:hypothetical protein